MGLIPNLPKLDMDIGHTVNEFLTLLKDMNAKLDTLIELQRQSFAPIAALAPGFCSECEEGGRPRCTSHGELAPNFPITNEQLRDQLRGKL